MLGLEHVKNTNLKSQTHTKRGTPRFTRFGKMPTSLRHKRDILMIYTRLQEDYKVLSRTLTSKQPYSKMGSHPLFIKRRKNSQISSRSDPKTALTRLSVDRSVNQPKCTVDRAKSCKTAGLTGYVSRPAGRPTRFLFSLSILVDRAADRSKPCACRLTESPVIELKNSLLFLPSLHSPPR